MIPAASCARSRIVTFRAVLLLTVIAGCFRPSLAQPAQPEDALRKGAWALQFQITSDFTLRAFEGTTISAKKHLSARRALRFGVILDAAFSNEDAQDATVTADASDLAIGGTAQWLFYRQRTNSPIHLYFGPGLRTIVHRTTLTREDGDLLLEETTRLIWSAGLTATLGVEWLVHSHISLLAEYGSVLQLSIEDFNGDSRRPDTNRTTISLRPDNVRFGLSVYL